MRVGVAGSSGLIGTALVRSLREDGHDVRRLVRSRAAAAEPGCAFWDPEAQVLDPADLEDLDGVVNLAGAGFTKGRWTERRKRTLLESRTRTTGLLARTLATLGPGAPALVSASGVGYYGDGGDEVLAEDAPPGTGFLADLVRAWEGAADPAREADVRVAHARSGVVLAPGGGLLGEMLLPFRLGLGGRIGSGRQWMSWITLTDEVRALRFLLDAHDIAGPVNLVSPEPVTNQGFVDAIGHALRRPTVIPTPLVGLRAVYGRQLVDELILVSQRAHPGVLAGAGFEPRHPELEAAMVTILGRGR